MKTELDATSEQYAEREPLFSVLTQPRYLRGNLTPQVEAEFFESGEDHVRTVLEFVRARVDTGFAGQSVLEFGCGPGRLALAFARRFPHVTAVDISASMLNAARNYATRFGRANISFQTLPEFLVSKDEFDLVNCHSVLQRVSEPDGLEMLRMLLGRIRVLGVIQIPYHDRTKTIKRMTRTARARLRPLNALANLALHKDLRAPLQVTTTYDLNEVFATMRESGFSDPQVVMTREGDLDQATIYIARPRRGVPSGAEMVHDAADTEPSTSKIDVRSVIESSTIDSLNATAEAYFAGLSDWEHHIVKPFSKPDEAPTLLINLAVLLQGLNLAAGTSVLDFGAGTGWLSRFLTQLGCRVTLLDVSESALRIAKATFERIPIVGERPAPSYLVFNGRHIDLPDESVDRIVCFDAFHHAPNPGDMIREFGRILKPGGIAGFAEPGPAHSQTAQSQFEMRTYGVVENDVDVHAIWSTAQSSGFTDIKLAAYTAMPFQVALRAYDDLLAGGETLDTWSDQNRRYLANVRNFFLFKAGEEIADSRHPSGLRAHIVARDAASCRAGLPFSLHVSVTNSGHALWLPSATAPGGVSLGCHLYDRSGRLLTFDFVWSSISSEIVKPGRTIEVTVDVPPLSAGTYKLELDCVAHGVTWFAQVGSATTDIALTVV